MKSIYYSPSRIWRYLPRTWFFKYFLWRLNKDKKFYRFVRSTLKTLMFGRIYGSNLESGKPCDVFNWPWWATNEVREVLKYLPDRTAAFQIMYGDEHPHFGAPYGTSKNPTLAPEMTEEEAKLLKDRWMKAFPHHYKLIGIDYSKVEKRIIDGMTDEEWNEHKRDMDGEK